MGYQSKCLFTSTANALCDLQVPSLILAGYPQKVLAKISGVAANH